MDDTAPAAASSQASKLVVSNQSTLGFESDAEAAEKADVSSAVQVVPDSGSGNDRGGSVVPKQDCPHVKHHVKIALDQLPDHPQTVRCTFFADEQASSNSPNNTNSGNSNSNNKQRRGQPKADSDDEEENACALGENWLCLECGAVGCSRYVNGHGLSHWKASRKREDASPEGHCLAASLADLSVWCYECESYVQSPILDPYVQKLDQLKLQEASEPKKKKARPSLPHGDQVRTPGLGQSSGDETSNNNTDENDDDEDDDDDDEDNESDSDNSPSIIDIATAVARGIPLALLAENDEQELQYPFESLPKSLSDVSNFIQSEKCRSIVILAGAGMSVSAGIPDFRSANGLYATMNPDLLSADPAEREAIRMDPTVALEHGMFLQNPLPCLELNREFILGTRHQKWKATLAHRFVELLHNRTGKLARLYTQNIDGLEDQCTQLPRDKVIAVHGSMDRAECAHCGQEYDYSQFCARIRDQIKDLSGKDEQAPQESTPITCTACGYHAVKPAIVLFRSRYVQENE
jgi:NAD-dependent SIR2 family protein deacetylase